MNMAGITEQQKRILAELEEAWESPAAGLLNTIIAPRGDLQELAQYQNSLKNLLRKKFVEIEMDSEPAGSILLSYDDAISEIDGWTQHYLFSIDEKIWGDSRNVGPPYYQTPLPRIMLTDEGNKISVQILTERGYQWWVEKDPTEGGTKSA